jgi:hypothetical protein
MSRFSKNQMLEELRTIFLFEGDHLLIGAGTKAAESLMGFPPGDDGEYCHCPSANVDLKRFEITGAFERGYAFAFRPSVTNTLGDHEVQDLTVFMLGTPRAGGILSGGETHAFMTPEGLCQTVADTVMARWKLECDTAGSGSHTFTTRELALLADMTEGAVRNALADKSKNGLRAVPGAKNPVVVEHAEALRWLMGRRGFIPMPDRPLADRFLLEQLQAVRSTMSLGQFIQQRISYSFTTNNEFAHHMQLEASELEAWISGNQAFDLEQARELAYVLDLDIPVFVGKTLEVTLRRDLAPKQGLGL